MEKYCTAGQVTDGSMAHAHFRLGNNATNTQSEFVILIALPLKKWLQERASILRLSC
jgi:hypothetical protein